MSLEGEQLGSSEGVVLLALIPVTVIMRRFCFPHQLGVMAAIKALIAAAAEHSSTWQRDS